MSVVAGFTLSKGTLEGIPVRTRVIDRDNIRILMVEKG